jgi:hypothetical protein
VKDVRTNDVSEISERSRSDNGSGDAWDKMNSYNEKIMKHEIAPSFDKTHATATCAMPIPRFLATSSTLIIKSYFCGSSL